MSQVNVPPSRQGDHDRRRRAWVPTIITVVTIAILGSVAVSMVTDWLWYKSVAAQSVYSTLLASKLALFAIGAVLMGTVVALNSSLAWRARPVFASAAQNSAASRYFELMNTHGRRIVIAVSALAALISGMSLSGKWAVVQLFWHSQPFGQTDAQFHRDFAFYVFDYPFYRLVLGFSLSLITVSFIAAAVAYYLSGAIAFQAQAGNRITRSAQIHLASLVALFLVVRSVSYYLDRFGLALKDSGLITGLRYVDIHAHLPALEIMSGVSLLCAALLVFGVVRGGLRLPALSLIVMFGTAILVGGIYPAIVQQLQVKPSEVVKEAPYIARHIDATRESYQLTTADVKDYAAAAVPSKASLQKDAGTLGAVRLLDPYVMSTTFSQLQQIKGFYSFPATLDVDRYELNGGTRGTLVATRDINLDGLDPALRNWANDHIVFTHGFGLVAAYDNTADPAEGKPVFTESDIPPRGNLKVKQPRVYFGESSPAFSIVGAAKGTSPTEFDYPTDAGATGQANYTYQGKGGVSIGSPLMRLLFASKYKDANFLLSNLINSDSRILWDRAPATRVQKVAPWLTLDGDPYPAVINGRITWILDAYTTTANIPYAAHTTLGEVTIDSLTGQPMSQESVNYIRNSVKATVDAYDGTVTLYAWDNKDPILKAWSSVFPGIVKARTAMPAALISHIRYPEDLFKVQREVLARFHVKDPRAFYSGQDFWVVPNDPTRDNSSQAQPPYYLTVRMPDQAKAQFSLTTTFAPNQRPTLAAFMAVNSTAGPDYGRIRVLQLPRSTTIPGPTQAYNNFESDTAVSAKLSLLRAGGSEVDLGNLLSLPVAGGVLYVEPVYVRASKGDGFPVYRKVLVSYGNRVAFEDTLSQALGVVFKGAASGAIDIPATPNSGTVKPSASAQLTAALAQAQAAYNAGQAALAKGDFTEYGRQQKRLAAAIAKAAAVNKAK